MIPDIPEISASVQLYRLISDVVITSDDEEEQEGDITWDCCISIFPDGSYVAYNLNHDDEEELGEDFKAEFDKHIDVLSKLQLVIPVEGRDYGILNSRC